MPLGRELMDEERRSITRLYEALKPFKEMSQQMPVGQVMAFLLVVLHEGKSLKELSEIGDAKMPTMSRQLIDLGVRNRRMEPGYMLIEQRQNPLELRSNQYSVSLKGYHMLKSVMKAFTGDAKAKA